MTIAFVGVSGVGKSTFLQTAMVATPFMHLEASKLIKEELALVEQRVQTSEELRTGAVLENQRLLVRAFHRCTAGYEGLVVLDGHTVVDAGLGLQMIPASVFAEMNMQSILFLQDDPEEICARRHGDTARVRPKRSPQEIEHYQQEAMLAAARIALELEIPLQVVTHGSAKVAFKVLRACDQNMICTFREGEASNAKSEGTLFQTAWGIRTSFCRPAQSAAFATIFSL
ncbi:ATP-binding protein [Ruegeria sp. SCP11]|uniref:ATP-binding protein n=1 Tax=Ruegeria sp. SCP11 TaxID=3141378 RepID=UPI003336C4C7